MQSKAVEGFHTEEQAALQATQQAQQQAQQASQPAAAKHMLQPLQQQGQNAALTVHPPLPPTQPPLLVGPQP